MDGAVPRRSKNSNSPGRLNSPGRVSSPKSGQPSAEGPLNTAREHEKKANAANNIEEKNRHLNNARKILQLLADKEIPEGQYRLAEILIAQGEINLALDYLEPAAKQGNTSAQCRLAECYLHGIGVSVNEEKAFEWFKKAEESALERCCPRARILLHLGVMLCMKDNRHDVKEGEVYLLRAEAGYEGEHADNPQGIVMEEDSYYFKPATVLPTALYLLSKKYFSLDSIQQEQKDIYVSRGELYLKFAAKLGHSLAQFFIEDPNLLVENLSYLNKNGNEAFEAGQLFCEGRHVTKDTSKAFLSYKQAAAAGNTMAKLSVGKLLMDEKDHALAENFLMQALDGEDLDIKREAAYLLYQLYLYWHSQASPWTLSDYHAKAIKHSQIAADAGHSEAKFVVGQHHFKEGNYTQAKKYFSFKEGEDARSCEQYLLQMVGRENPPIKANAAFLLYQLYMLDKIWINPKSVDFDCRAQARKYCQIAADTGHVEAKLRLGQLCFEEFNNTLANEYLLQVVGDNNPKIRGEAAFLLYKICNQNLVVPAHGINSVNAENITDDIEHCQIAADAGHREAQLIIGTNYFNKKNNLLAEKYLLLAVKSVDQDIKRRAALFLARLYEILLANLGPAAARFSDYGKKIEEYNQIVASPGNKDAKKLSPQPTGKPPTKLSHSDSSAIGGVTPQSPAKAVRQSPPKAIPQGPAKPGNGQSISAPEYTYPWEYD